jgi:hypothetical protein
MSRATWRVIENLHLYLQDNWQDLRAQLELHIAAVSSYGITGPVENIDGRCFDF